MLNHEHYMQLALDLLSNSKNTVDVPIAAIVVDPEGEILSSAVNSREVLSDPTAHAEILALREAAKIYGQGWRLVDCSMYVTIEPCTMCAGAIGVSRIANLIYGASEPKFGAVSSIMQVLDNPSITHKPAVTAGILSEECGLVMKSFFKKQRDKKHSPEKSITIK